MLLDGVCNPFEALSLAAGRSVLAAAASMQVSGACARAMTSTERFVRRMAIPGRRASRGLQAPSRSRTAPTLIPSREVRLLSRCDIGPVGTLQASGQPVPDARGGDQDLAQAESGWRGLVSCAVMASSFDPVAYNRAAWDREVESGNEWTRPAGPEVIARARAGDWSVVLIGYQPVPRDWFPAELAADLPGE